MIVFLRFVLNPHQVSPGAMAPIQQLPVIFQF